MHRVCITCIFVLFQIENNAEIDVSGIVFNLASPDFEPKHYHSAGTSDITDLFRLSGNYDSITIFGKSISKSLFTPFPLGNPHISHPFHGLLY